MVKINIKIIAIVLILLLCIRYLLPNEKFNSNQWMNTNCDCEEYGNDTFVQQVKKIRYEHIDPASLSEFTYQNIEPRDTVILMYTKWCKYSEHFFPIWKKTVGKFINSNYKFKLYNLDEADKYVIAKDIFKITQVPSVFILRGDTLEDTIKYTGELDEGEFTQFLTDNIQ